MANFSCHIPKDYSWVEKYKKQLGASQVMKDYESMYDWLLSQPVGWKYNLEHAKGFDKEDVRDYKIKLICTIIADKHYDFEFNKTFTELKRVKIDVKQKKLDEEGNAMVD